MNTLNTIRFFFLCLTLVMTAVVATTAYHSDIFVRGGQMWREEPWFRATLYDFYAVIAVFVMWVFYRERSKFSALLWTVAFVFLGSIGVAFYVFCQLMVLKPGEAISKVLLKK